MGLMKHRSLVIYYSHSGVTEKIAQDLQRKIEGDIYEIQPAREYHSNMWKADEESQKERASGDFPPLLGTLPDLSDYDVVFIGGPVWRWTPATPLMSYLLKTDFQGKIVAPFWTYIERDKAYAEDFRASCRNALVKEGLGLTTEMIHQASLDQKLSDWLVELGF